MDNELKQEGPGTQADAQRRYYDDYWSAKSGWKPTDRLDDELRSWLDRALARQSTVLDIGCGDGHRYGRYLIERGISVHGIDVSDVAVEEANAIGIRALRASLDQPLPFPDSSFDSVVCFEVFEHLLDPEFAAREVHRVLRPNGSFLMSVPNVAAWRNRAELLFYGHFNPTGSPVTSRRYPWRDPHIRFFNSTAVRNMLHDCGFAVIAQGGLDTQFLSSMPGLRAVITKPWMRPADRLLRRVGMSFYSLLAGRCIAVAQRRGGSDFERDSEQA
jgi:methionine biosynthesis protein MetW